jgi:hypothetical protein
LSVVASGGLRERAPARVALNALLRRLKQATANEHNRQNDDEQHSRQKQNVLERSLSFSPHFITASNRLTKKNRSTAYSTA